MSHQFMYTRDIEDAPTPDEWDRFLADAVDSLLTEGMDPFFHTDELEARVRTLLAESESNGWEDYDLEEVEYLSSHDTVFDGLDFVDLSGLDVEAIRAGRVVA